MNGRLDDLGKLVLRFAVGGLLLVHGVSKLQNGIGFVEQMVNQNGLPAFLAYFVYAGEVLAPVLVIAGILTRPAALIIALDLMGAVYMARRGDIAKISGGGAWAIEVEVMFILGGLAIACLGAGRMALAKPGRYN
jgi:putative oxidoreductase